MVVLIEVSIIRIHLEVVAVLVTRLILYGFSLDHAIPLSEGLGKLKAFGLREGRLRVPLIVKGVFVGVALG